MPRPHPGKECMKDLKDVIDVHSVAQPSNALPDQQEPHIHMEPTQRQEAVDTAGQSSRDPEGLLERLVESRYGSLERLVAMQVMFYHMAARVAGFW